MDVCCVQIGKLELIKKCSLFNKTGQSCVVKVLS